MNLRDIQFIEPSKELIEAKEREKRKRIWGCGVKPVCANCENLIDNGGSVLSCKPRPGIIPRDIADNLTCVWNCHGEPDFKPKLQIPKSPEK